MKNNEIIIALLVFLILVSSAFAGILISKELEEKNNQYEENQEQQNNEEKVEIQEIADYSINIYVDKVPNVEDMYQNYKYVDFSIKTEDVNDYKDAKYEKIIKKAKRIAREVQNSHVNATLDPMTSDERRVIHNTLSNYHNIKTESSGRGPKRAVTIYYLSDEEYEQYKLTKQQENN